MIFKNNKVYDVLVWISSVVLPALAILYTSLASAWGLPYADEISNTILAIDVFLGALLKVSSNRYQKLTGDASGSSEGTRYKD